MMFTKHQGFRGALRLTLVAAFGVSLVSAMKVNLPQITEERWYALTDNDSRYYSNGARVQMWMGPIADDILNLIDHAEDSNRMANDHESMITQFFWAAPETDYDRFSFSFYNASQIRPGTVLPGKSKVPRFGSKVKVLLHAESINADFGGWSSERQSSQKAQRIITAALSRVDDKKISEFEEYQAQCECLKQSMEHARRIRKEVLEKDKKIKASHQFKLLAGITSPQAHKVLKDAGRQLQVGQKFQMMYYTDENDNVGLEIDFRVNRDIDLPGMGYTIGAEIVNDDENVTYNLYKQRVSNMTKKPACPRHRFLLKQTNGKNNKWVDHTKSSGENGFFVFICLKD